MKQRQQAWAELVLQGVAGRAGIEEGIQRFVVPLGGIIEGWGVKQEVRGLLN